MKNKSTSESSNSCASVPRVAVAIMAAGKGTRLKSAHPKVLHEVGWEAAIGARHRRSHSCSTVSGRLRDHRPRSRSSACCGRPYGGELCPAVRATRHWPCSNGRAIGPFRLRSGDRSLRRRPADHTSNHRSVVEFPPRLTSRDDPAQRRPRPPHGLRTRRSQECSQR